MSYSSFDLLDMHVYYLQNYSLFFSQNTNLPEDKQDKDLFYGLSCFKNMRSKLVSDYAVDSFSVLHFLQLLFG